MRRRRRATSEPSGAPDELSPSSRLSRSSDRVVLFNCATGLMSGWPLTQGEFGCAPVVCSHVYGLFARDALAQQDDPRIGSQSKLLASHDLLGPRKLGSSKAGGRARRWRCRGGPHAAIGYLINSAAESRVHEQSQQGFRSAPRDPHQFRPAQLG
jgi:hypothetical protein